MTDRFYFLDEPQIVFGSAQCAEDPHDGLALFGAYDARAGLPGHAVIGTARGLALWHKWIEALNGPAACVDLERHRPWPPYPGFDVAFGTPWPDPVKTCVLSAEKLSASANLADKFDRTYAVANHYLDAVPQIKMLDEKPAVVVCVVPDEVYQNCRPKQYVREPSDKRKTAAERKQIDSIRADRDSGQVRMFSETDPYETSDPALEKYDLSPDFRRQLKARMMQHELPVQIIKESVLDVTDKIRDGEPGTNPLSDRLWNFATGIFYKSGRKPWILGAAREGVCYIGLAYKRASSGRTACCAAQLFLDSGDGLVFVGDFGPWYSEDRNEFHLTKDAAHTLLSGALNTYEEQDGRPLKEIFLHARSGINADEFAGFSKACPGDVNLVGIRVRKDRFGPRLFRHDEHPIPTRRGKYPVIRGVLWQRTLRHGLLFTSGFKQRIAAYDGFEVPVPLGITLQQGKGDLITIAQDILSLTKANYNACQLGESEPITVKYSDRVGEILLSNPELPKDKWQHNFKYYI